MTKSSAGKAAAKKARGTHRKTARKVGAGKAHGEIARQLPKSSPRKRAAHIARPPLNSRNSLPIRKCQSRCALWPIKA